MLSVQRAEGLRALLQATHGSPLGSLWGGQLRLHPWEDSVLLQRRRDEALPAALHGAVRSCCSCRRASQSLTSGLPTPGPGPAALHAGRCSSHSLPGRGFWGPRSACLPACLPA